MAIRLLTIGPIAILLLVAGYSFYLSRPVFDETYGHFAPEIADPTEALTFARTGDDLLWVTGHHGDAISGINLSQVFGDDETANLLEFFSKVTPAELTSLGLPAEQFPLTALQMPLEYHYPYVAAGTNFKEHADEVYSDDPPFLFPKLARAGHWDDTIPFTDRLDFEAELCVFPLADVTPESELPRFGLVLCNDFTDRWTLVTQLDLGEPLGQTGFADGKGQPGYMPTGYLVVVPGSADFYRSINLSLYVNDALRQRFGMVDVILPVEEIVKQALRDFDVPYERATGSVPLLPEQRIPAGTLILTGTAAGVIFKPLNIWRQAFYLQPGDVVRTEATWLGHLENTIGPASP